MKTIRLKDKKLWMWEGMMVLSLVLSGVVYCGLMRSMSGRLSVGEVTSPMLLYVMPCVLAGVVSYYMYGKTYGAGALSVVQLGVSAALMWGEIELICGDVFTGAPEYVTAFTGLWLLGAVVPVSLCCYMAVRLMRTVEAEDWREDTSLASRCRTAKVEPHRREIENSVAIYSRANDIRYPAR
ncbi:MAG: hypothetical protein NC117_08305 [Pseudoflavonifractor sp.]|nr:hypothetical protein [Pseudoflavonifractor sp.]